MYVVSKANWIKNADAQTAQKYAFVIKLYSWFVFIVNLVKECDMGTPKTLHGFLSFVAFLFLVLLQQIPTDLSAFYDQLISNNYKKVFLNI